MTRYTTHTEAIQREIIEPIEASGVATAAEFDMTAHANCTHDNTKAARAKCRRDTRIALVAGDQLEARTTQTGIPIRHCDTCGHHHPITRNHCTTCGKATLYCHPGAERK